MRASVLRAIPAVFVIDFILLLLSGTDRYKHAHGTPDTIVSYVFWFGFLIGAVVLLALVGIAVRRKLRGQPLEA
jgi:hypothetical protein